MKKIIIILFFGIITLYNISNAYSPKSINNNNTSNNRFSKEYILLSNKLNNILLLKLNINRKTFLCNKINNLNIEKFNLSNKELNLIYKKYNKALKICILEYNSNIFIEKKRNLFKNKQIILLKENLKKEKRKNFLNKINNFNIIKQKRYSNSCVIDNIEIIFKIEKNKDIDKKEIYKNINKKKGEYWHSGLFNITEKGGKFYPIEGYNDFQLLNKIEGIYFMQNSNIEKLKAIISDNKLVLMEVPMNIIYSNVKKWDNNLYHAITIYKFDYITNELFYINTLSGKIETINLNKIIYNNKYLKYPFRYLK